jgi:hypothetical protein
MIAEDVGVPEDVAHAAGGAAQPKYGPDITIEVPVKSAAGAIKECAANKWSMALAVVAMHGTLVYYENG